MDNLSNALLFGGILNTEEITHITRRFERQELKSGNHFFMPGQISDRLGFVDNGIFRVYVENDEGEEATKYFFRQNQFMMDIDSFYHGSPTIAGIQAVTEAHLLSINRQHWFQLNEDIPKLFMLTKSLTEAALINKIKDSDFLRFGTASQKYEAFVKRYPDLALKVPLQYIASYLQITPQSLSRIRKRISDGTI